MFSGFGVVCFFVGGWGGVFVWSVLHLMGLGVSSWVVVVFCVRCTGLVVLGFWTVLFRLMFLFWWGYVGGLTGLVFVELL